jgi:hypothetical protein
MTRGFGRTVAAAILFGALLALDAGATTTQQIYANLWSKHAVNDSDPTTFLKPKAACVCTNQSASDGELGVFAVSVATGVGYCGVPAFNGDGSLAGLLYCSSFVYIGK